MLNETSVRCFLTLAQTLSFTETAKIMYMTQQSVSKYIAKMEEDLGFQLFIRTHHYVMLTRPGRISMGCFPSSPAVTGRCWRRPRPITTRCTTPCTSAIWSGWRSPPASARH